MELSHRTSPTAVKSGNVISATLSNPQRQLSFEHGEADLANSAGRAQGTKMVEKHGSDVPLSSAVIRLPPFGCAELPGTSFQLPELPPAVMEAERCVTNSMMLAKNVVVAGDEGLTTTGLMPPPNPPQPTPVWGLVPQFHYQPPLTEADEREIFAEDFEISMMWHEFIVP